MAFLVDIENESGHVLVTYSTPREQETHVSTSRDLACRLLEVDKEQDNRTLSDLWRAYKDSLPPPQEEPEEDSKLPDDKSPPRGGGHPSRR